MAEVIYQNITKIKKNNPELKILMLLKVLLEPQYTKEISSGKFHDTWFEDLEKNKFIDVETGKKIPEETIRLLEIQKDITMKQLVKYPELYYAKSSFPLEISQRAFDHLWRICESYELWCKETGQSELISLNIID